MGGAPFRQAAARDKMKYVRRRARHNTYNGLMVSDFQQLKSSAHMLLSVEEMYRADKLANELGIDGETLMENAGAAVATEIRRRWSPRPVSVLCGPGNNGGDGFVIARHLADAGWPVRLGLIGTPGKLAGDAACHAARWDQDILTAGPALLDGAELVVDALFGAGLDRPITGAVLELVEALNTSDVPVVAVDIPSGIHGDSGAVMGAAAKAVLTVTFFRRKPGHLLVPGRSYVGEMVIADIGIPDGVLSDIKPETYANHPDIWLDEYVWPAAADHKYGRGHGVILGGGQMTGAARLAAQATRRVGAGLVTIASPVEALPVYAAGPAGVLTAPVANEEEFAAILEDVRKNAVLIGPGSGVTRMTRDCVLAGASAGRSLVLDADALTSFDAMPSELFLAITGGNVVLTPHEGEFARIFSVGGDKLARARQAATLSGVTVVLKGADSVIAAPDGRAVINENAPPALATAGSGDVLAGFILGLLAQGMPTFAAASAAVWLHGEAGARFGPGVIAEDLPEQIPHILRNLI